MRSIRRWYQFNKPEAVAPGAFFFLNDGVKWGGAESPLVVYRNGLYYLFFTYAHRHYYETIVCVSQKCDEFSMDAVVTTLYGHAVEILEYQGKAYLSSCGPEDKQWINRHGLYLAELAWTKP
ncbi:MAG: hypothetical protein KAT56_10315 [Sedimentisphaerales bacterium]|nr:hypothetical protein [Sedimentisphaerales bacterium]